MAMSIGSNSTCTVIRYHNIVGNYAGANFTELHVSPSEEIFVFFLTFMPSPCQNHTQVDRLCSTLTSYFLCPLKFHGSYFHSTQPICKNTKFCTMQKISKLTNTVCQAKPELSQ